MKNSRLLGAVSACIIGLSTLGMSPVSWSASLVGDNVQAILSPQTFTSDLTPFTSSAVQVIDPGSEFFGELSTALPTGVSPRNYSVTLDVFADYFTVTVQATNAWTTTDGSIVSGFGIGGASSLFDIQLTSLDLVGGIGPVALDPSISQGFIGPNDVKDITWTSTSVDLRFGWARDFAMYGFSLTTPVPIPPAAWLFGSGLLGLIGIARRKNAA